MFLIDWVEELVLGEMVVVKCNVMINEVVFNGYFLNNLVLLGVLIVELLV